MNFLTNLEREQLKLQHRRERDGRIRDRIKAVLLYDEGWAPKDIARVLLISDEAVRNHIDEYKTSKKLKPESGGSTEKLSADQSQKLEAHLQMHTYLYVKDIVAYVEVTFGIFYTAHGRKVHVFCDNAPYYRNKAVKQYLETSKVCLHFLPPYSPNLNPIERLWKWMKERVIYNTYYEHFEDFKGAIFGFFSVLSTVATESVLGQLLRSRVRDRFRAVGAARIAVYTESDSRIGN